MNIRKPKFWNKKNNIISLLLIPISIIFQLLIVIKTKFTFKHNFKIPVICIGNIYVGGTGKTPLAIFITKELLKRGKRPAIIKKFYREHIDEHDVIKHYLNCLFLNKVRAVAINNAEKEQHDIAILDDGFQDFSIEKDLNILCFNSEQLIGNGMTLPSGPLRENINSIKKAQIILINGKKDKVFENKILSISNKTKIFYSKYTPINIQDFKNKKLFAFAGIGNPDNFFKILTKNNLNLYKKIAFPDHYEFNKLEIKKMIDICSKEKLELVTTEKDYFRIKKHGFKNIKFLKIKLEIEKKDQLINQILDK